MWVIPCTEAAGGCYVACLRTVGIWKTRGLAATRGRRRLKAGVANKSGHGDEYCEPQVHINVARSPLAPLFFLPAVR